MDPQRQDSLLPFFTTECAVVIHAWPTLSVTEHNPTSIPPSRLLVVGAWIAGIASAGGVVAMDLIAIDKIRTGQGLDTFRSRWLVEDNWIGFLVFVVATTVVTVLAPVMGWLLRRKERREIQQFQSKYSEEHHGEQVD